MAMNDVSQVLCTDEERKAEKIIYKRRSSVFHSRSIVLNEYRDSNKTKNDETKDTSSKNKGSLKCNMHTDIETFDLKDYIEKLRQERRSWQQEYRKRKIERKNLTKQKASVESQGQILDINVLTDSERAFLIARPNYEYMCKNSHKLLDMASKVSTLSQLVHKLNQRFMINMENNIRRTTRNVIKMSEY